jgi:hypothetical protein
MSGMIQGREELRGVIEAIEADYRAQKPPFDEIRLPEWDVRDIFQGSDGDYANYLTLTAAVDYMKETAGEDGLGNVMHELSLLPERVERVLPERHETITFCMIWRSVSAAAAA